MPYIANTTDKASPVGWSELKLTSRLGKTTALHNASEEFIACTKAIATHSLGQPMKILPIHSGLPPSASLASGLRGFSTGVCLLPAAPGTEHYASSLRLAAVPLRSQRSSDRPTLPPRGSEHLRWLSSSLMGTGGK